VFGGLPAEYTPMALNVRVLFGRRLRELRLKQHLSQEKLAELSGLHITYVGGIERGQRNVSLVNIVKLARALKVKPGDLFKGVH